MQRYSIDLPFPISVNNLYRVVRGKPVTSAAYRDWTARADLLGLVQHVGSKKPLKHFEAEIYLDVLQRSKRDLDNYAKGVLDWAQRVNLIHNDRACEALFMRWSDAAPEGCLLILTEVPK